MQCKNIPYDSIAECYDELFGDLNPYYGPISVRERELFVKWVPETKGGAKALDIGCGTGFHTEWLVQKGYQSFGIDISRNMLEVAKRKSLQWKSQPAFLVGDILNIDESIWASVYFDLIICLGSTLNHIENWELFSGIVSRRLRPGGIFLFSYDNFLGIDSLFWLFKKNGSGYEKVERGTKFLQNISCLFSGKPFKNHWKMQKGNLIVEVPLVYEPTYRFKKYLDRSSIRIKKLCGVHLLSCFSEKVLEASALLKCNEHNNSNEKVNSIIQSIEGSLSNRIHFACANTIGVAIKE